VELGSPCSAMCEREELRILLLGAKELWFPFKKSTGTVYNDNIDRVLLLS